MVAGPRLHNLGLCQKWLVAAPTVPLNFFFLSLSLSLPCLTYRCIYSQLSSKQSMQSRQNKKAILSTTEVRVNLREGGGNVAVSSRPDLVVIYHRVTFLCGERLIGCIGVGRRDRSSLWGRLILGIRRRSRPLICSSAVCSPDCLHVTPSLLKKRLLSIRRNPARWLSSTGKPHFHSPYSKTLF